MGDQIRERSVLPSFQEAEATVILLVVMVVTMVMMVVIIVMVAVVVMPTMRWRISVGLLPVVEVALVPRRWLLLRRVVRPLRWSLGRWILTARRRVRLRVPCGNRTEPGSDRS